MDTLCLSKHITSASRLLSYVGHVGNWDRSYSRMWAPAESHFKGSRNSSGDTLYGRYESPANVLLVPLCDTVGVFGQ